MQRLSAAGYFISENTPLLFVQKVKGQIGHTPTRVCNCTIRVTSSHILFVFVSDVARLPLIIAGPSIHEMLSVFKMLSCNLIKFLTYMNRFPWLILVEMCWRFSRILIKNLVKDSVTERGILWPLLMHIFNVFLQQNYVMSHFNSPATK